MACPTTAIAPAYTTALSGNATLSLARETVSASLQGEVQVFPNPASNYITLSYVSNKTGNSKVVLYSIDGRKVLEADNGLCDAGIKYEKKIDVSKLNNGIYFVQLRNPDKTTYKKIIINQ